MNKGWTRIIGAALLGLAGFANAQPGLVLSGSVDNPDRLTAALTAYAIFLSDSGFRGIASGDLRADGSFSVELPREIAPDRLRPVEPELYCSEGAGSVAVSPAGAAHAMVVIVMALINEETVIGAIMSSSDEVLDRLSDEPLAYQEGDFYVTFLYAQRPFSIQGSCFDQQGTEVRFSVSAPAGWSYLQYGYALEEPGALTLRSTSQLPAGAAWRTIRE